MIIEHTCVVSFVTVSRFFGEKNRPTIKLYIKCVCVLANFKVIVKFYRAWCLWCWPLCTVVQVYVEHRKFIRPDFGKQHLVLSSAQSLQIKVSHPIPQNHGGRSRRIIMFCNGSWDRQGTKPPSSCFPNTTLIHPQVTVHYSTVCLLNNSSVCFIVFKRSSNA